MKFSLTIFRLWDSRSGGVAKTLALESQATSIELSHDREVLTVAHGKKITIVDASRSERLHMLQKMMMLLSSPLQF